MIALYANGRDLKKPCPRGDPHRAEGSTSNAFFLNATGSVGSRHECGMAATRLAACACHDSACRMAEILAFAGCTKQGVSPGRKKWRRFNAAYRYPGMGKKLCRSSR